jgi:hypothetical protein
MKTKLNTWIVRIVYQYSHKLNNAEMKELSRQITELVNKMVGSNEYKSSNQKNIQ